MPQLTTAALVAFSSFMSLGLFCSPAPPPQPPPQEDLSATYRKLFAHQYSSNDGLIKDILGKIEMEEANYQDWHAKTDDKAKQLATYSVVAKKHDDLVARTATARTDYETWVAFYEANKNTVSTQDECSKFGDEGQAVRKTIDQIYLDYISIRPTMIQIAR